MAVSTALIIGAGVALVGAGVSAYGQYQAGKSQNAIAQFNAQQQENQARTQAMALQTQAAQQKRDAEANFKLRSMESNARIANAKNIESTALMQDAVNRRNLRERREEFARGAATQRAAIAASGVSESSGTPLDIIADFAAKTQIDQEETHYVNEVQRRTLFSEAALERLGGKMALAGATLNRDSALAQASLTSAAARSGYLADKRGAELTRLTGKAAQTAGMYGAGATLLSGVGSAASSYATFKTS